MSQREYTNGEVTVTWKPGLCIHSKKCFNGLPKVFNPNKRPWVNLEEASTDRIIDQVKQCPSGALSYHMNNQEQHMSDEAKEEIKVEVAKDGPLMVHGDLNVKLPDGNEESRERVTAFCRCGASANKPFCDGSHKRTDFKG